MKLVKKDFCKWDKEELSIIKKGYTAKEIADYILYLQDSLKTCGENCAYFGGKYYELKEILEAHFSKRHIKEMMNKK